MIHPRRRPACGPVAADNLYPSHERLPPESLLEALLSLARTACRPVVRISRPPPPAAPDPSAQPPYGYPPSLRKPMRPGRHQRFAYSQPSASPPIPSSTGKPPPGATLKRAFSPPRFTRHSTALALAPCPGPCSQHALPSICLCQLPTRPGMLPPRLVSTPMSRRRADSCVGHLNFSCPGPGTASTARGPGRLPQGPPRSGAAARRSRIPLKPLQQGQPARRAQRSLRWGWETPKPPR